MAARIGAFGAIGAFSVALIGASTLFAPPAHAADCFTTYGQTTVATVDADEISPTQVLQVADVSKDMVDGTYIVRMSMQFDPGQFGEEFVMDQAITVSFGFGSTDILGPQQDAIVQTGYEFKSPHSYPGWLELQNVAYDNAQPGQSFVIYITMGATKEFAPDIFLDGQLDGVIIEANYVDDGMLLAPQDQQNAATYGKVGTVDGALAIEHLAAAQMADLGLIGGMWILGGEHAGVSG